MPETPLQTLLRAMGQQQPNFLPQPQAQQLPPMAPPMVGPEQPRYLPPQPGMQQREQVHQQTLQQMRPWFQGGQGGIEKGSPVLPEILFPQGKPQDPSDFALPTPVGPPIGMAAGAASRLLGKGAGMLPAGAQKAVKEGWQAYRTAITDRLAPLRDFTAGLSLPAKEDPYITGRLFSGHGGKVANRLDEFQEILKPFASGLNPRKWGEQKELRKLFKEYAVIDRMREQALFGIDKFPNGATPLDLINRHRAIEALLTPEQLRAVQAAEPKLTALSNKVMMDAVDSGLVSKKVGNELVGKYKKYIPLHVIGGDLEAMQRTGMAATLQVTKADVLRTMTGSTKEVADPIESMIRNIYRITNQAERNRVAVQVANLEKVIPQSVFEVKPIGGRLNIPDGFGKITAYRDGVPHSYAVPEPVADAIKGMGKQQADIFTQWASKSTAALRAGATSLNAAFIPSNAIRDIQTAKVISRGFGSKFTAADWVSGFASSIKKDDAFRAFQESGASFSGYNLMFQPMKTQAKQMFRTKGLDAAMTITNPFQLINKVGQVIEAAPRIGTFKRARAAGLDSIDAAWQARNLTVDFDKAGNLTKIANLWVPFLNARMQGTINLGEALFNSKNPGGAWATAAGIIGIPQVATYLNNRLRFPEIYNDIARHEKDNYFIAIYGDGVDERGHPTEAFKMPKGDIGRILGNPLESFLDYMWGYDPKSMKALALEALSDISPISFAREGELSGTAVMSSVLPPTVKAGVETTTGVNTFTGRGIEPIGWVLDGRSPKEMYYKDTPTWAVKLSEVLADHNIKLSPLRILNAVGTQFGGLGRQIADPEKAPQMFARRFLGARGGEIQRKEINYLETLRTKYADIEAHKERAEDEEWERLKSPDMSNEKREQVLKEKVANGELPELIRKAMMEHKSPLERNLLRMSAPVRAEWISNYVSRQTPEVAGYMQAKWMALGIITPEVMAATAELTKQRAKTVQ